MVVLEGDLRVGLFFDFHDFFVGAGYFYFLFVVETGHVVVD